MKRSEMINMIVSWMKDGGYTFPPEEADELLDVLEFQGMLPPKTKLSTIAGEDNAWDEE